MKTQTGMTLIETVLAMALLAIISTAIIGLAVQVLSNAAANKQKNAAANLAEQSLEQIRYIYQSQGWKPLSLRASATPGTCYNDLSALTTGDGCIDNCTKPNNAGNFFRYGRLTLNSALSQVKVESVVTWLEKGQCQRLQTDTYFYDF